MTPTTSPTPRGPLSEAVLRRLQGSDRSGGDDRTKGEDSTEGEDSTAEDLLALAHRALEQTPDVVRDEDIQCALFVLYASAYGSLDDLSPELEWDTGLIEARRELERAFEQALRQCVATPEARALETSMPRAAEVARALFRLVEEDTGPSLSRWFARKATKEQAEEFLVQRSVYTLREADPHSWAIPRLRGRPKAALVEIQADEYGGGRPDRVHAELFAASMREAGLDDAYGAYLDAVPAITLASQNAMSMFGLNRRLLGAIVGHLAAFEMTSSIPNRLYADGFRRLGFGEGVTEYFDEHVEADAVHEQIAAHDLAGALAEDRPELLPDILFGAAACLSVDGWAAAHMLEAWSRGETSLRTDLMCRTDARRRTAEFAGAAR